MDIMIDLETLSTLPTAAIVQIGAIAFDPYISPDVVCDYKKCWFDRRINLRTVVSNPNYHVDGETLLWWMNQSPIARRAAFGTLGDLDTAMALCGALRELWDFFIEQNPDYVWFHGSDFDCAILRYAYHVERGTGTPWKYNVPRDVRTLIHTARKYVPTLELPEQVGVEHDAIADCVHQIHVVRTCHEALRAGV